jgi:hypothetical protein
MILATATPTDMFISALKTYYPTFEEYAKVTILYIGAAGIMIQVIKAMRGG